MKREDGRRRLPDELETVEDFGQLAAVTLKAFAGVIFVIFASLAIAAAANYVGGTWGELDSRLERATPSASSR